MQFYHRFSWVHTRDAKNDADLNDFILIGYENKICGEFRFGA